MEHTSSMEPSQQIQQLQEQLSIKEQENQQLLAQLAHLRSWMNSLQQRARANDPHALLVARELYVGGVPEGTTEVRSMMPLPRSPPRDNTQLDQQCSAMVFHGCILQHRRSWQHCIVRSCSGYC